MIYMTCIQNISFFLLKVNNPSVHHPIWPPSSPHRALCLVPSGPCPAPVGRPVWPPSGTLFGPCWATRLAPVWHPVWPLLGDPFGPRLAPYLAPVGRPVWPPVQPPSCTPFGPCQATHLAKQI
jgi:hypothetical protein